MPPSPPSSGGLFDPRVCITWGISLFLGAVTALAALAVAMRAQKPGEPMSKWSKLFLTLAIILASISIVLLAYGFGLFSLAARAYGSLTGFWQGALLGVAVTALLEALRLKLWGRYIQKKRLREASTATEAPPPALIKLHIVAIEEKGTLYLSVHNLGDMVKVRGLIHPLSGGVEDWPVGRTSVIWEEDTAEQTISIERGDRRRLVVGRCKGKGEQEYHRDQRFDFYRWILAFRVSDGKKMELPTRWMKKYNYTTDALRVYVRVTIIAESPVVRTFYGDITFQGEWMECSSFRELA